MSTVYSLPRNGKLSGSYRPYFPVDPNQTYSFTQDDTQQTSEGMYNQTSVGKLMIESLTRYVVGKGLTPMSSPETDILNWSTERVSKFRKQSEAFWRLSTDNPSIDYYGKDNFNGLQRTAFKNSLIEGDVLRHIGYRRLKNGDIVPYIQNISGRMVSQEWNEDTLSSTGGVIIDKETGREVGYCLRVLSENRDYTGTVKRVNRYTSKGRLEFDLISVGKSDPSLIRGIPLLTTMRDEILDYNSFRKNHLAQSAAQTIFTAFIEKQTDAKEGGMSFTDKLLSNGGREMFDGDERKVELGSGYVVELEPGEHVNLVQRQAQGDDFDSYGKAVIGLMASSIGMSYEVAMNEFQASFSASRASISGAEKNFQILREEFATKYNTPVWEEITKYGILTGNIDCPEWESLTYLQKKALLAVTWTGVTPPQVDPNKEVTAFVTAIQNGLCTREYAIRMLYGMDAEEVAERLDEEQRLFASEEPHEDVSSDETETEDDSDNDTENENEE